MGILSYRACLAQLSKVAIYPSKLNYKETYFGTQEHYIVQRSIIFPIVQVLFSLHSNEKQAIVSFIHIKHKSTYHSTQRFSPPKRSHSRLSFPQTKVSKKQNKHRLKKREMPCTLHTFLYLHCGCIYHIRDATHSNPNCNRYLDHTVECVTERCDPRCTRSCTEQKAERFLMAAAENRAAEVSERDQGDWVVKALEELSL